MNALEAHIIDTLLTEEKSKQTKERNEPTTSKESTCIGHLVNTFDCILNNSN